LKARLRSDDTAYVQHSTLFSTNEVVMPVLRWLHEHAYRPGVGHHDETVCDERANDVVNRRPRYATTASSQSVENFCDPPKTTGSLELGQHREPQSSRPQPSRPQPRDQAQLTMIRCLGDTSRQSAHQRRHLERSMTDQTLPKVTRRSIVVPARRLTDKERRVGPNRTLSVRCHA